MIGSLLSRRWFARYRKATGFSQERFAYEAGLDRAGYGRLERGEGNLTYLNIRKLLVGLGVSWRDFGASCAIDTG